MSNNLCRSQPQDGNGFHRGSCSDSSCEFGISFWRNLGSLSFLLSRGKCGMSTTMSEWSVSFSISICVEKS